MKIPRSQCGFTLVETLVALTILAIALVGIWKVHITVLHTDLNSNKKATAAHLANRKMEELKATTFSTLNYGQQEDCCSKTGEDCVSSCSGKYFHRSWTISAPPIAVPDTRQVSVQVGWGGDQCDDNLSSCKHSLEFLTFLTNL